MHHQVQNVLFYLLIQSVFPFRFMMRLTLVLDSIENTITQRFILHRCTEIYVSYLTNLLPLYMVTMLDLKGDNKSIHSLDFGSNTLRNLLFTVDYISLGFISSYRVSISLHQQLTNLGIAETSTLINKLILVIIYKYIVL